MELDNRIVNDKIFTPFDSTDCMKWWLNLEGYFADDYCDFSDLDKLCFGKLKQFNKDELRPFVTECNSCNSEEKAYRFWLPEKFLRRKQ